MTRLDGFGVETGEICGLWSGAPFAALTLMPVRPTAAPNREGAYVAAVLTAVAVAFVSYVALLQEPVVELAAGWLRVVAVPAATAVTVVAALLAARPYGLRRSPGTEGTLVLCAVAGMVAGYAVRAGSSFFELWRGHYEVVTSVPPMLWIYAVLEAVGLVFVTWLLADLLLRGPRCGLCGERCTSRQRTALVPARRDEDDLRLIEERNWTAFRRKSAHAGWLRFDVRSCSCSSTATLDVYRGRWGKSALARDHRLSSDDARSLRGLAREPKPSRATTGAPVPVPFVRMGRRPPSSAFRP